MRAPVSLFGPVPSRTLANRVLMLDGAMHCFLPRCIQTLWNAEYRFKRFSKAPFSFTVTHEDLDMKPIAPPRTGSRWLATTLCALAVVVAAPLAQAGHGHERMSTVNIVEVAADAGQFETLIAAAKAAGLVDALTGDGPLTVFAPTDEAFSTLPAGTVETLLKPENRDQLARILKFHVVSGRVASDQLADGVSVETLAGEAARFEATEGGFTIEGARITATDINASNGIVHVIDRVILPPERVTRVSKVTPDALIRMTIDQGAPMFNHGNHEATAAMYMIAAQSLMSFAELGEGPEQRLARGIMDARAASSAANAAWALRDALDDVNDALADSPMVARR